MDDSPVTTNRKPTCMIIDHEGEAGDMERWLREVQLFEKIDRFDAADPDRSSPSDYDFVYLADPENSGMFESSTSWPIFLTIYGEALHFGIPAERIWLLPRYMEQHSVRFLLRLRKTLEQAWELEKQSVAPKMM